MAPISRVMHSRTQVGLFSYVDIKEVKYDEKENDKYRRKEHAVSVHERDSVLWNAPGGGSVEFPPVVTVWTLEGVALFYRQPEYIGKSQEAIPKQEVVADVLDAAFAVHSLKRAKIHHLLGFREKKNGIGIIVGL